jgi:SAM-dependent methyltransferase
MERNRRSLVNLMQRANGCGDPTICVGCCSTNIEQVESVSAEQLARAWVQSGTHGAIDEEVRTYVLEDLGTARIAFWLCANCGLEFAHPMKSWADKHYPGEQHRLGYDHQLALAELAKMPPMRLLEIGCADGQFLERASLLGHETTGIDFSEQDISSARQRGVNAHVGDIAEVHKMKSSTGKFNLIALFQVIEHLRDPGKIFGEILEIAEPGAVIMVGCPSHLRYSRVYSHQERIERSDFWDYPPQHLLRWTPQSLVSFLERFNFQTERIAFEPLSILGATAHLTALQGLRSNWYGKRWRRRSATLAWLARLTVDRLAQRSTGIRLFVKARLRS